MATLGPSLMMRLLLDVPLEGGYFRPQYFHVARLGSPEPCRWLGCMSGFGCDTSPRRSP